MFAIGDRVLIKLAQPGAWANPLISVLADRVGVVTEFTEHSFNAYEAPGPAYLVTFDEPIVKDALGRKRDLSCMWFDPSDLKLVT